MSFVLIISGARWIKAGNLASCCIRYNIVGSIPACAGKPQAVTWYEFGSRGPERTFECSLRPIEFSELIYPGDFASRADLLPALDRYFQFYNHQRPHQALSYRTPVGLFPHRSLWKRSRS
jgi:transposase InsO family protein